jgi:dienelactone hydrolase
MREDVTFDSEGTDFAGWLYQPDDAPTQRPAVVMAHGFGGVKEMDLPPFAEHLAGAGFTVLLFDYRYFGLSSGRPRQKLSPWEQLQDYRNAITWLSTHPATDPDRIAAWGTSLSGAHILHLAAFDSRIKAAVSQVPAVDAWENAHRIMTAEQFTQIRLLLQEERRRSYATGSDTYLPISAPAGQLCALPDPGTYVTLQHAAATAPTFRNEITMLSMDDIFAYAPAHSAHCIDTTPVLMVLAGRDVLTPPDLASDAYHKITSPKRMLRLDTEHHGIYEDPWRTKALEATVEFLYAHLDRGSRDYLSAGSANGEQP